MKKLLIISSFILFFLPSIALGKIKEYNQSANFRAGEIVSNSGTLYECTQRNETNQCNFGSDYEPGVGIYRKRTWTVVKQVETPLIEEGSMISKNNNGGSNSIEPSDVIATTFIPTKTYKTPSKKDSIPGTPSISVLSKSYFDGDYALNWTIPVNSILGDTVKLYENGKLVLEKEIDQTSQTKGGTFSISNNNVSGTFKYNVVMCLKKVCSSSGTMNITVTNGSNGSKTTTIITKSTNTLNTSTSNSMDNTSSPTKDTTIQYASVSIKRDSIPSFSSLPKGSSFDDLGKKIETELKSDIKSGKKTKTSINEELAKIDLWISYLSELNEIGDLTGSEKRSVLILLMMKEIYSNYN